jgi:hypothetical protein
LGAFCFLLSQFLLFRELLSAFPVSAFQFCTVSAFARLSFSMSAFQLFSFGSVMPVSLSAF